MILKNENKHGSSDLWGNIRQHNIIYMHMDPDKGCDRTDKLFDKNHG